MFYFYSVNSTIPFKQQILLVFFLFLSYLFVAGPHTHIQIISPMKHVFFGLVCGRKSDCVQKNHTYKLYTGGTRVGFELGPSQGEA